MTSLKEMWLTGNNLEFLPSQFIRLTSLTELNLEDNPLSTIPVEIISSASSSAPNIKGLYAYLQELEKGSENFSQVKIMIVGEGTAASVLDLA